MELLRAGFFPTRLTPRKYAFTVLFCTLSAPLCYYFAGSAVLSIVASNRLIASRKSRHTACELAKRNTSYDFNKLRPRLVFGWWFLRSRGLVTAGNRAGDLAIVRAGPGPLGASS